MMQPPRPRCSTHGVHHTPGKGCRISKEDEEILDEYDQAIYVERRTWGKLQMGPLPSFHPIELEKGMTLREKIRNQERKRLEQERNGQQGS